MISLPTSTRFMHYVGAFLLATSVFALCIAIETQADATGAAAVMSVRKGRSRAAMGVEERLYNRLHGAASAEEDMPAPAALEKAISRRMAYMEQTVSLRFLAPSGEVILEKDIPLSSYGALVTIIPNGNDADVRVDADQVKVLLVSLIEDRLSPPVHCAATGIIPRQIDDKGEEMGYEKLDTGSCILRDGVTFNVQEAAIEFARLARTGGVVTIPLQEVKGQLYNMSGRDLGGLQLLSSGVTNYKGSTWARAMNIKKAINHHINGIIIEPGVTFAFNETLGGPVTQGRGWYLALGIFGGGELRPTPGGGICQTSTTMYRAALYAGLPIVEQSNHSLFVTYYEKYGVGLDATIFPGFRDLKFTNDTGAPLVLQAYVDEEKNDVTINILGTPDGRKVTIEGPYFSGENPPYVLSNERPLRSNEIAWVRRVIDAKGNETMEVPVSRYRNAVGNWVRKNWAREDIAAQEIRVNF